MAAETGLLARENEARFILPALLFTCAILVVPLGFVLYLSLTEEGRFTFEGYAATFRSALFWRVLWTTLEISATSTAASLLLGYPIAFHLSTLPARTRNLCMVLVLLPFWTSILVKSFAFIIILGHNGIINSALRQLFGEAAVLPLLFNRFGVTVGMAHYLVPFAVLLILANLLAQDRSLRQAAEIMGATPWQIFWRIIFPLSLQGVAAAGVTCFVISVGFFITPSLLGGRQDWMLGNVIDLFTRETLNWTQASVIAVLLLAIIALFLGALTRVPGALPRLASH